MQTPRIVLLWGMASFSVAATSQSLGGKCCPHFRPSSPLHREVECVWNLMSHGDAREGKWRGNWRMEWVAGTLHTTSERGVSSITTADAHTTTTSSRLYWRPRRFKWTRPFRRKTKSGFYACAIMFQTQCSRSRQNCGPCLTKWAALNFRI